MKTTALMALPVLATAKVLIAVTTPYHAIGDTYNVEWLTDTKMVSTHCTGCTFSDAADSRIVVGEADQLWLGADKEHFRGYRE